MIDGLAFIAGFIAMGILWFIKDTGNNSPYSRGYRDGYMEEVKAFLKTPRGGIRMKVNDVVQFNEKHKWCGCLGIITEDKGEGHPRRFMIGVPVPQQGTAYIFDDGSCIERIGDAVFVEED